MKVLYILIFHTLFTGGLWQTNFIDARKTAAEKHELILLNFSGSDWCTPCMRMSREIFENTTFTDYAASNLVLVNADFPMLRKNRLDKKLQQQNDALAEKYNAKGKFPLTLILDSDGKVLKYWEGLLHIPAREFVNEIKALCDINK